MIYFLEIINPNLDVVKYLVSVGENVNAREDYALRYSELGGHLNVVQRNNKKLNNILLSLN